MMKRKNVVIAVVLWACALGTAATAQEIEWERTYSEEYPLPLSGGYYSGRHILPMADGGYVVTSVTGGGFTAAVTRFDREGKRLWERGITDTIRNVYISSSNDPVYVSPRFTYVRENGQIMFFGNVSMGGLGGTDYGFVYQLLLDEETGEPLDTLTGLVDSATYLDNGTPVCQMEDKRFMNVMAWPFPNLGEPEPDSLGMLYFSRLTVRGGYDDWAHWHFIGERKEGEEVWHYPARVIQMPDGGFVIFGTRQVTGGSGTLFLLKIDSLGGKVWEGQTEPENTGKLAGMFFDTTTDGGFVAVGMATYQDATAERKRWRVMRLVKFSENGAEEWSREYQSTQDYTTPHCVRQTADGGYLIAGTVGSFDETYSSYLSSKEDAFLLKTDNEGEEDWRKQWGDSSRQDIWDMVLLSDGSAIVTGSATKDTVWNGLYLAKIRIGTAGVANEEEPAGTLTVTPNPARDRLRVAWHSVQIGGEVMVRLYDLLGREMLRSGVLFRSSGSVEMDVSELPVGTYQAVIGGEDGGVLVVRSIMIVR